MRERIQGYDYISKINRFITGELEEGEKITATQVNAMFNMLDRVLPKLSQQTITVEREKQPREMTLAELQAEWDQRLSQMETSEGQTVN